MNTTDFDWLDLGCKEGNSMEYCQQRYGGRGLGVDIKESVIKKARKRGFDVVCADVKSLDFADNSFRFIAMMDFLEHLPDFETVKWTLEHCKRWASEFFFIHHPSFEDIDYLKSLGLKLAWTDWHGHPSMLTIKDFTKMFKQLGITNYEITQGMPYSDSSFNHLVPLSAPIDTVLYDSSLGDKPAVAFDRLLYGRVNIEVRL